MLMLQNKHGAKVGIIWGNDMHAFESICHQLVLLDIEP
jgi:hypothetical protein